jgi:hypothetical protein
MTDLRRPPVERYVRASVEIPGGSIEVGVQYQLGESTDDLRRRVRELVQQTASSKAAKPLTDAGVDDVTHDLELRFEATWPTLAWFVEVWNETEALTQVYAPRGMPIRDH